LNVLLVLAAALLGARVHPIVAVGIAAAAGAAGGIVGASPVALACAGGVAAALSSWFVARGVPWWLATALTTAAALLPGPHRVALPPFDLMFAPLSSEEPPSVLAGMTLLAASWTVALVLMAHDGSPQAPASR